MEEYLPTIKKIAIPFGIFLGIALTGTRFDISKIDILKIFKKKESNSETKPFSSHERNPGIKKRIFKIFRNIIYAFLKGRDGVNNNLSLDEDFNFSLVQRMESIPIEEVLNAIKELNVDPNKFHSVASPLFIALRDNRFDIAEVLIAAKANPNEIVILSTYISSPLLCVLQTIAESFGDEKRIKKCIDMLKLLVENDADPDLSINSINYSLIKKRYTSLDKVNYDDFKASPAMTSFKTAYTIGFQLNLPEIELIFKNARLSLVRKSS